MSDFNFFIFSVCPEEGGREERRGGEKGRNDSYNGGNTFVNQWLSFEILCCKKKVVLCCVVFECCVASRGRIFAVCLRWSVVEKTVEIPCVVLHHGGGSAVL